MPPVNLNLSADVIERLSLRAASERRSRSQMANLLLEAALAPEPVVAVRDLARRDVTPQPRVLK